MPSPYALVPAGFLVGLFYGTVGIGGAVLGTPVLALLGVPGIAAVATPLVATVPAAIGAAFNYRRRGEVDRSVVLLALVGAVPAVVVGALLSDAVGGPILLAVSVVVLGLVGVRLIVIRSLPYAPASRSKEPARATVVAWSAAAGLFTGLLANGGTFVFIPLFVLVLHLGYRRSVGTSLVVAATLSVPAVITHAALGHIDWTVAAYFGVGLIPGAYIGSHVAPRIDESFLQATLGWLLIVFAISFLIVHLIS